MEKNSKKTPLGTDQKVCNIKDIRKLAARGRSGKLEECNSGDILVFNFKGKKLIRITNAMARVCNPESISWVNSDNATAGVCVFTGRVLEVLNY